MKYPFLKLVNEKLTSFSVGVMARSISDPDTAVTMERVSVTLSIDFADESPQINSQIVISCKEWKRHLPLEVAEVYDDTETRSVASSANGKIHIFIS